MNSNRNITVNFALNTYTLTLTVTPPEGGSVTKDPDLMLYDYGMGVCLTAVPHSGYTFSHWSGNLTGSTIPGCLTMDANKTVTAIFIVDPAATSYRSKTFGNWADITTWESSTNGGSSWSDATASPTSANSTITILNGHIVTVAAPVTVDQVTVNSGGTITVNSGQTLTIANGIDAIDMIVNGTLVNSGTVTSAGVLAFGSTGTYQHAQNIGTVPIATWQTGSTCLITGITGTSGPTGLNQSFYHFTWNCPSQSGNLSLNSNLTTINGNFTVTSTGATTNNLRMGSGTFTVNIGGDVIVNGANPILTSTGSATYAITVNVGGNIIISSSVGGGIYLENAGTGTATWNLTGNFTMSGGVFSRRGSGTGILNFIGGRVHTFTKSAGTIESNNGGPVFNVSSGGTLHYGYECD